MTRKSSESTARSRRTRTTLHAAAETAQAKEQRLWSVLQPAAAGSIQFWNSFFALRSGSSPLTPSQQQRLVDLLRAICWVETKHGTFNGGASHGTVDVIQCCDTRNPWWHELLHRQPNSDRFVGGPGRPNWWTDELPAAVAGYPAFNSAAAISTLQNPEAGSSDPGFTPLHSLYWGVPLLLQKTNNTAGDKTFQCGDLDRTRLLAGAQAYNGGGDPKYRQKVDAALDLFGGASLTLDAAAAPSTRNEAGHHAKPVVISRPSPNYALRQGNVVQYLILHNTDAPLRSALQELTTPATAKSAHYVVSRAGEIYQLVQDSETAWHAGNKPINQQSIGIELEAWKASRGLTPQQEDSLIALARFILDAYDVPLKNVLPHRDVRIGGTDCPGWIWPTEEEFFAWTKAKLV